MPMLVMRVPLSEPPPASTPATSIKASASVRAPARRRSLPLTTAVPFGMFRGSRRVFVAETTMP
jgi:hypothetical protein